MKWKLKTILAALAMVTALAMAPMSVAFADDDLDLEAFDVLDDSDSEEGSILELDDSDSDDVDSEGVDSVDSEDSDSEDADSEDSDDDDSDGDLDDSDSDDDSDVDPAPE